MRIVVSDDGAGIDPAALPDMFNLFVQADSTPGRAQGGLGIGLTLVRSFVEMHGGTVTGASDGLGRGSRFTVRLPLLADAAEREAGAGDPQRAAAATRPSAADSRRRGQPGRRREPVRLAGG